MRPSSSSRFQTAFISTGKVSLQNRRKKKKVITQSPLYIYSALLVEGCGSNLSKFLAARSPCFVRRRFAHFHLNGRKIHRGIASVAWHNIRVNSHSRTHMSRCKTSGERRRHTHTKKIKAEIITDEFVFVGQHIKKHPNNDPIAAQSQPTQTTRRNPSCPECWRHHNALTTRHSEEIWQHTK